MIAALAALTLSYSFPAGSRFLFDFQVNMEGYLPLLGRPQSNVEVKLVLEAAGLGSEPDGNASVICDLLEMKASLSGVPLPFTVDNVKSFFPKATLSVAPTGKVLKTDVPDVQLPVRLPGLDPKRIPDITFLPIEFPAGELEVGKPWNFKRTFNGSDATYTVTTTKVGDEEVSFEVKLVQATTLFEDSKGNEVKSESEAANKVETAFTGSGAVVFDRKRGLSKSFIADSEAVSQVTDLKSGNKSERRVKSKLKSTLRQPTGSSHSESANTSRY
jgi:hypothetical protein